MTNKDVFTIQELLARLLAIVIFQFILIYGFMNNQNIPSKAWLFLWVGYKYVEDLLVENGKFYDVDKLSNPYKYLLYFMGLIWLPTSYFLFQNLLILFEGLLILWFVYTLSCYGIFVGGKRKAKKKTEYGVEQFKVSLFMLVFYQFALISLFVIEKMSLVSLSTTTLMGILVTVFYANIVVMGMLVDSGKWYETRNMENGSRLVIIVFTIISAISAYMLLSHNELLLWFMLAQIIIVSFLLLLASNYFCYKKSNQIKSHKKMEEK